MRPFKAIALAGLLGITALATGCNDRKERPADSDLSEQMEKAGDEVKHGTEELKEEVGGSGAGKDGDVGKREGVINDGEGPLEEKKK